MSSARHRFEYLLFDWAENFSRALCGVRCGFFLAVRDEGTPRRIYFASPAGPEVDGEQKNKLAMLYPRWFVYTPGDEAGAGYLEWFDLERAVVERWIGRTLEPTDFLDVRTTASRDWPSRWRISVR